MRTLTNKQAIERANAKIQYMKDLFKLHTNKINKNRLEHAKAVNLFTKKLIKQGYKILDNLI